MGLISDNVIPGEHGKVFGTDAKDKLDLKNIKKGILQIQGVKDVEIDFEAFPKEFTVYTRTLVDINEIQDLVTEMGFHAVPKNLFEL